MKKLIVFLLLMMLLPLSASALTVPVAGGAVEIIPTDMDGEQWFFLPAFADRAALFPDAVETEEEGVWQQDDIHIMQSENLRALFLVSTDPVNEGREYIDNCEKHVHKTTGAYALVGPDGQVNHAGELRQLRGRGNGTWLNPKKPYQIKLEERADLLDTGDSDNAKRTWTLLAEASGSTMIHNRITFDLALELGMSESSPSEHVDLYYDGDYRGTYLIAEKVEINEGRIEETDYEELIETWNNRIGQNDLDLLPAAEAQNRFGNPFSYIEGLADSNTVNAGAYLLEMEVPGTLSDRCWTKLSDGGLLAVKNPENASKPMMEYISTRIQEARITLENGGVNPENGRTLADDFDVDAFARTMLIQEFSGNFDGYNYSSSFFVLPAGESRFRPGPVWDFDLAYRFYSNGRNFDGVGFKEGGGWMYAFYQCPEFVDAMREICEDELYPMITDVLLGTEEGDYLRPLDAYIAEIEASRRMNARLWQPVRHNRYVYAGDHAAEVEMLRRFLTQRSEWLYETMMDETLGGENITLWANASYAHVDEEVNVLELPWNGASVTSASWSQLTEATEEEYAQWQLEIVLKPKTELSNPKVTINGTSLPCETQEDGSLLVTAVFEDPSYRPVDYYGEDIGWVYNPEVYLENHPEALENAGGDLELLMDYFCDEGMYEDHKGNAFFRPSEILIAYPDLEWTLGEDWWTYYYDYLSYGRESDKWILRMGRCFWLDVQP